MSDPSKNPPGTSGTGKKIPAANPSSAYGAKAKQPAAPAVPPIALPPAKAKPPVVGASAAPAGQAPMLGQAPFPAVVPAFPSPNFAGPGNFPPKPAPPIPTPRNTKGLGLIIGLVVAIPVCLVLVCGVGGYFIFARAKKSVTTAVNNAKNQNSQTKNDPNDPFAALNDPNIQKQMEQGFEKAFDKLDEEMKKQQSADAARQKRGKTRSGSNSGNGPIPSGFPNSQANPANSASPRPGEPAEKDDLPTNLKRLQTGNDDARRRAADWFSRAPLETDKQDEVSQALNNMHTDSLRKHALGALKVWGTKENVPIIAKIMQQEAFVKIDCMDMLEKFKDERAIEPLISTLNEAFREGERAEELLADWWPQAEQPLVKHLHDKEGRIRERSQRILELRKTDQSLLITQTLEDLKSSNREVRHSAVTWLAKLDVKPDLQPQVAAAAQSLLSDSNNDSRRQALEMFGKYAQKEQADELVKLIEDKDRDKWMAGLTGLIRLGDVRAAEPIGRRKELRGDAFRLFREAGAPAQDIVSKTLTHIEVKDWGAGKDLCEILGEIGTTKSVGFLQQVKKKATLAKTPFVPEAADKAVEDIRRRNAG
ncbi:MAG: HEAT repeat domain-containing protein [Pirellulaceae bacterium]